MFAALIAIFLHAFAIQTHVHAYASASVHAEVSHGAALADTTHDAAFIHQPLCAICQTLSNSGRAALPETPAIAAATSATYETVALEIRRAPRTLAHSWQSRAPPIAL